MCVHMCTCVCVCVCSCACAGMRTEGGGGYGPFVVLSKVSPLTKVNPPPKQVSPKVKSQYSFAANNNESIRKEIEWSQLVKQSLKLNSMIFSSKTSSKLTELSSV